MVYSHLFLHDKDQQPGGSRRALHDRASTMKANGLLSRHDALRLDAPLGYPLPSILHHRYYQENANQQQVAQMMLLRRSGGGQVGFASSPTTTSNSANSIQYGSPSWMDVQRAQNILANAFSNSNASASSSLSEELAASRAMMAAARLGGNPWLGQNIAIPPSFAQDPYPLLQTKNQSSATAGRKSYSGIRQYPTTVPLEDIESILMKERLKRGRSSQSSSGWSYSPPRKRIAGPLGSDAKLKLAAEIVAFGEQAYEQEHEDHQQRQQQLHHLNAEHKRKKAKTFPVKLMEAMIENLNEDAVAWLLDGKSFVVVQPDLFVDAVLKKVFKGCKYASFVRKLHRWGFVRLTSGTGTDCFHHALFQRDHPALCARIVCTPRDGSKVQDMEKRKSQQLVGNEKPPSLAGVEKFFRAKYDATHPEKKDIQNTKHQEVTAGPDNHHHSSEENAMTEGIHDSTDEE